MKLKAIVFDMDGTLLDTLTDLKDSLNHTLRRCGYPERTLDEVRHFVGSGIGKLVSRAMPNGEENPTFPVVFEEMKQYYADHCRIHTRPYDGIPELLKALHDAGYPMAVVSNKVHPQTVALREEFFKDTIDVAIGAKDGVPLKPAPESVWDALEQLGCDKEDAVYIGDSDIDVATARNSGLRCISVLWGFRTKDELLAVGADCFVETPAELQKLLEC